MFDIINMIASLSQNSSLINSAVFVFYIFLIAAIVYFFKFWVPERSKERESQLKLENDKLEVFKNNMKHNNQIMLSFKQTLDRLDCTLNKVSDKLIVHDVDAKVIGEDVKDLESLVLRLKEKTPTMSDLDSLERKVESCKEYSASSKESDQIIHKLDEIMKAIIELKNVIKNKDN